MSSGIVPDKSNLPIHARRTDDSMFDRIWKYYYMTNKQVVLTEQEERIRQRMEMAWQMDCSMLSRLKIARRLMKKFDICQRQAYYDIDNARLLFSDPTVQNREAKRQVMNHILENAIKKAYIQKEYKALANLILRYDKLNGLSEATSNPMEALLKNMRPAAITFTADPEALKKQAEEMLGDVVDAEYEESDEADTEEKELLP